MQNIRTILSSNKFRAVSTAFLLLLAMGLFVAQIFSAGVLIELAVSMLPLMFPLLCALALLFIFARPTVSKQAGTSSVLTIATYVVTGAAILTSIMNLYSFGYIETANEIDESAVDATHENIRVASYNKLYLNRDYSELSAAISAADPDIVGLVEFTAADYKQDELFKKYPYSHFETDSFGSSDTGIAIYSKYPISARTITKLSLPILEATVKIDDSQELDIVIVHTSAPTKGIHLERRGKQLGELAKYLKGRADENTILMGDFNISPWSPEYREFAAEVEQGSGLVNAFRGEGIFNFTWRSRLTPLLTSQIDHIFVSGDVYFSNPKVGGQGGSDHNLVYLNVKL